MAICLLEHTCDSTVALSRTITKLMELAKSTSKGYSFTRKHESPRTRKPELTRKCQGERYWNRQMPHGLKISTNYSLWCNHYVSMDGRRLESDHIWENVWPRLGIMYERNILISMERCSGISPKYSCTTWMKHIVHISTRDAPRGMVIRTVILSCSMHCHSPGQVIFKYPTNMP